MKCFNCFLKVVIYFLVIQLSSPGLLYPQSQTPVYLTFTTHNEDAEPYNNFIYYRTRRNFVVQLADSIQAKGAKWNFQSDWRFLQAVKNFDTGSVTSNTNGKNLIKWLIEDKGIDCDPHSHESNGYNYADVAYLHSQLGITPSKVVGGFLYDTVVNGNNWENLEDGMYGRIYTSYFWQPDILWGGGTQGHVNDPQNFGVWKPQSMENYYIHDSTKHLTLIGNGCNNKIYDTTLVTTVVQRIRNVVNAVTYNAFPDSGVYTATVHTQIGQLNASQINKVCQFIDSVKSFVNEGKVIWKNLDEIYDIWNTAYGKKPFRTTCAQLPAVYSHFNIRVIPEGFYNESGNHLNQNDTVRACLRNTAAPFEIIDSAEAVIDSISFNGNFVFFRSASGIYYLDVKHRNSIETYSKAGGEAFTAGSAMNYDFTSSQSQAYGNNLKLKGSRYCIYSGDCYSDGIIDLSDLIMTSNDASSFINGYVLTDIDGDNNVSLSDLVIAYNNSVNFAGIILP
ncbi:MAG: hypothetical protein IPL53_16855 [Ignavibacteria bacterium]|nr:hypothetical protein [Ignavibacteria bacterium]